MNPFLIFKKAVNTFLSPLGYQIRKLPPELGGKQQAEKPQVEEETSPTESPLDLRPYRWLIRRNIAMILDIGANTGQFAHHIHKILPKAKIISFEPLKDCYDELVSKSKELGHLTAYNFALGEKEGEVPIYRSEFSPSSSLLHMGALHKAAFPHTKRGTVEKIKIKKLDSLKLKLAEPLLVKIDVQGFEDHVINGGKKTVSKAAVIIIETSFESLYDNQPLFDRIYVQLKELGFEYHGNWFQDNDQRDGTPLQSDSIFIKKSKAAVKPVSRVAKRK